MQSRIHKNNRKGFTLVEVIVVAVIVAVLALVGIQLYQGYVIESQRNTAENLAASAASFLQTVVNSRGLTYVTDNPTVIVTPLNGGGIWSVSLSAIPNPNVPPVSFTCPANAVITVNADFTVSATVSGTASTGTYPYR